jgi:hypothetical protein
MTGHGTQGTVVRAKHALDYGLIPGKVVHGGPDHALDLRYGVTLHIFIHGPDPTQTTHAVTYHGLHRGPYHSHDVGRLIVVYVLCTMSSMLWYPMHRTIKSTVLRMGEVGCPTTPAHSSIITPSSHDS